jgi:hypothetical protein
LKIEGGVDIGNTGEMHGLMPMGAGYIQQQLFRQNA